MQLICWPWPAAAASKQQVRYLEGTLQTLSSSCKYGGITCDICLTSPRRKEGTSQPVPRPGLCRPSCRCRISTPVRSYLGLDSLSRAATRESAIACRVQCYLRADTIDSIGCQSQHSTYSPVRAIRSVHCKHRASPLFPKHTPVTRPQRQFSLLARGIAETNNQPDITTLCGVYLKRAWRSVYQAGGGGRQLSNVMMMVQSSGATTTPLHYYLLCLHTTIYSLIVQSRVSVILVHKQRHVKQEWIASPKGSKFKLSSACPSNQVQPPNYGPTPPCAIRPTLESWICLISGPVTIPIGPKGQGS